MYDLFWQCRRSADFTTPTVTTFKFVCANNFDFVVDVLGFVFEKAGKTALKGSFAGSLHRIK